MSGEQQVTGGGSDGGALAGGGASGVEALMAELYPDDVEGGADTSVPQDGETTAEPAPAPADGGTPPAEGQPAPGAAPPAATPPQYPPEIQQAIIKAQEYDRYVAEQARLAREQPKPQGQQAPPADPAAAMTARIVENLAAKGIRFKADDASGQQALTMIQTVAETIVKEMVGDPTTLKNEIGQAKNLAVTVAQRESVREYESAVSQQMSELVTTHGKELVDAVKPALAANIRRLYDGGGAIDPRGVNGPSVDVLFKLAYAEHRMAQDAKDAAERKAAADAKAKADADAAAKKAKLNGRPSVADAPGVPAAGGAPAPAQQKSALDRVLDEIGL